jgi:copper chaperone CopZ
MILILFLAAQLRSVDLSFEGIECASCVESLPARIQRLRGVESAKVDAAKQILAVRLAAENRVRIEQIRDAVEQDGTKTREATVTIQGTLVEDGNRWLLKVPNGSSFEISLDGAPPSAQYSLKAGRATVTGVIKNLRVLSITPTSIESD